MKNDEMLWASPSVILDNLKRLGTIQQNARFGESRK
jgi:hypothetical protein